MLVYEDHCVGCPGGLSCLGETCSNRNVPVHYCDRCGDELDDVYDYDGEELCEDCLKKIFLRKSA